MLGFFFWPEHFFRSYLVGHLFWLGIALGSLALVMVQHLSGGAWGLSARRILEAASRTIPALALLFVPVLLGMGSLYEWIDPEVVAESELIQGKPAYLDGTFFIVRAAIYFAIWITLAFFINRWSARQDVAPDVRWTKKLKMLSAPGLILYVFSISLRRHGLDHVAGAGVVLDHVRRLVPGRPRSLGPGVPDRGRRLAVRPRADDAALPEGPLPRLGQADARLHAAVDLLLAVAVPDHLVRRTCRRRSSGTSTG